MKNKLHPFYHVFIEIRSYPSIDRTSLQTNNQTEIMVLPDSYVPCCLRLYHTDYSYLFKISALLDTV